jgi:tetratricopeptide (TPR) repeat protein
VNLARPGATAAALALAAILLGPGPAAAARPEGLEQEAAALEAELAVVEATFTRPDETPAARARRQYADGETQFLLGDWMHAAVLIYGALDEPGFRASAVAPRALLYLGDALRNQGSFGAALAAYEELLREGAPDLEPSALIGAIDCRIKLRRLEGVEPLLDAARARIVNGQPAELAYLLGKVTYFRTDLRPSDRLERGLAAFGAVSPPLHVAATYFQGTLLLEAGDLMTAASRFEDCVQLPGNDPRQIEVRELCAMAAGRIYAEQGRFPESLDRYQLIPSTSPRFDEALYEVAWGHVHANQHEQALRTAALIADLAPESQLAPEATILTGHLSLRLGRYTAASEAFNKVINNYAPVRDELDAILTMHEDPVRYFNELIVRQGKAFDVSTVLPPLAVKWTTAQKDVGSALELVVALDDARQDLADSLHVIDRLEALLLRSGGLDAMPLARDGWINADALQNGSLRLRAELADRAAGLVAPRLAAAERAELERLRAARRALQPRLASLPRNATEVEARARRMRARVARAERALFLLGLQADAAGASVAGTEVWLHQHRAEIQSDATGRGAFGAELRTHRGIITGYNESLRAIRREIAAARDAVGGTAQAAGDAGLRAEVQALLEQEKALLAQAGGAPAPADAAELARLDAMGARLDAADAAAGQLKARLAETARRHAGEVSRWIAAERAGLQENQAQLAAIDGQAREVVGRIALRSFGAVRAQFYRLVLKADVGVVDVAWSRKRERVEKIQRISQQKAAELQAMDRDYKAVLREVE